MRQAGLVAYVTEMGTAAHQIQVLIIHSNYLNAAARGATIVRLL